MSSSFIDTNVLVYAFDGSDPVKQRTARRVLEESTSIVLSTQVLLEFFVVVTRKLTPPVPEQLAADAVAELARLRVIPTDEHLVLRAVTTSITEQISVWDAMIIEAAAEAGCDRILTEDLHTGSTIRDMEIVDPFVT